MYSFKQIREIFKEWQSYSNKIDTLKPLAWETRDEEELTRISYEIALFKEKQVDALTQNNRKQELEESFLNYLKDDTLTPLEKIELRENYRWFIHTAYVPKEISAYFQAMTADMEAKWALFEELKEKRGVEFAWKQQAEYLEKLFALRREMAIPVAEVFGIKPSEATLDFWNPYFRNNDVDKLIAELDEKVKPLIREHFLSQKQSPDFRPHQHLAGHLDAVQVMFSDIRDVMLDAAGWSKERLEKEGIVVHPISFGPNGFAWGDCSDIRMCVEFVGGDFMRGLGLVIHEGTHLLYTLSTNNAPEAIRYTPVGWTNSAAVHETCALAMEYPFFKKELAPLIEELVVYYLPDVVFDRNGDILPEWQTENIIKILTVQNNKSTAWYASEMSLLPNMIFRTLAERYIIDGELDVDDLPEFWAKTMEEWTGIVHEPKEFFVEESHWFDDNAGYFWSYQFGIMVGSAVYEQVQKLPKLEHIDREDYHEDLMLRLKEYFQPHIDYIDQNIFQKYCLETPLQIAEGILGKDRSMVDSYRDYILTLMED